LYGIQILAWARNFIFPKTSQIKARAYQASCSIGTTVLFLGVKQPGHVADHSPTYAFIAWSWTTFILDVDLEANVS